ncbi:uncharacterized protein BYT42DRAFT_498521, partial [Radiomyces spectabilis]|uniref:uncharacterized protein n=1 Tax=Radiomyces spectabilis TaxID=64574 RepID=UPI00221F1DFE
YKFGVLYVKAGQTKEEEWFGNDHSDTFDRFLNIIGEKTLLQGYTGWAGGLDVKSGDSGEYTYTATWKENELTYHVATLIPSKTGDVQQIQRKRHIGNDIVCIVFVEGKQPFNPQAIRSQFLHVFIVVQEDIIENRTAWRVEVVATKEVPIFGPPLPEPAIFFDAVELRSFLLAKCDYESYYLFFSPFTQRLIWMIFCSVVVNAEYAALKSPKFAQPMSRAREGILASIVQRAWKTDQTTARDISWPTDLLSPMPSRSNLYRDAGTPGHGTLSEGKEKTRYLEGMASS